jgi:hypothetical protein
MAKLSDDQIRRAVELRRQGHKVKEIAQEMGVHHSTISRAVAKYQPMGGTKGEPPSDPVDVVVDRTDIDGTLSLMKYEKPPSVEELMAAAELDPEVWIPQHVKVNTWEGFYKIKDGAGHRKVQLFQTKASFKRIIDEALEDAFRRFVEEHGAKPLPKKALPKWSPGDKVNPDDPEMLTWGIYDAHLGMYAWNSEVDTSYDMRIARNRICNSIDDVVSHMRPYRVRKGMIPVGNDFLHCDNVRNHTSFGDHHLDVDTRYAKILTAGLECMAYQVERGLEFIEDEIELIWVPGNHDYHASYALILALQQRYRNEPRIKVDLSANPRKFRMYGGVLIGMEHGQLNPKMVNNLFSTATHSLFSQSTYREYHVGHKHQRNVIQFESIIPTNGLTVVVHPALTNTDKWHHDNGFLGEPVKAVEVRRFSETALSGTHIAWARDEKHVRR